MRREIFLRSEQLDQPGDQIQEMWRKCNPFCSIPETRLISSAKELDIENNIARGLAPSREISLTSNCIFL